MNKTLLISLISASALMSANASEPFITLQQSPDRAQSTSAAVDRSSSGIRVVPSSDEADIIKVSYFPNDEPIYPYDGLKSDENVHAGVAVRIPRSTLDLYPGAQIVGLEMGWSLPDSPGQVTTFVKKSIPGADVATASGELQYNMSDPWYSAGWNTVMFAEPVPLDSFPDDLYMGYYVDMLQDMPCIPVSMYGVTHADSQYITRFDSEGQEGEWEDISAAFGPMAVRLLIEVDDPSASQNLAEVNNLTSQAIMKIGEPTTAKLYLSNIGSNDISEITLTYTLGDNSQEYRLSLGNPVMAGASNQSILIPVYALGTGTHTLTIAEVNGNANRRENRSITYDAIGVSPEVAEKYTRHSIIELYVSEKDYQSAAFYEDLFKPGYEPLADRISVVAHHMGDQFMIDDDEATRMLLDYADGDSSRVFMPVLTIDRGVYAPMINSTIWSNTPPIWFVYPMFAETVYSPAMSTPTFASINVGEPVCENGVIDVTINGCIDAGVLPEGEEVYLTVYAVENNVESYGQEFPDSEEFSERYPDGKYLQQNVIRIQPTPMYGEKLCASGDYSRSYSIEVSEAWNIDNMRIVAFLNRSGENSSCERNVINCAEAKVVDPTAISAVGKDSGADVRIVDGVLSVNDEAATVEVFTLDGRSVDASARLAKGVYIVKVTSASGTSTSKVISR